MDMFFEGINVKRIFDKKNLKFEKKSQFLADIGLFPIQTINKLSVLLAFMGIFIIPAGTGFILPVNAIIKYGVSRKLL